MLPLHLYRDFQVIAAGREVREGRIGSAITHLNFAARACFDLGENLSCNRLLDRADAAQIDLVNGLGKGPTSKLGKRGTLSRYFLVLQGEASEAVQRGELNRTRDLLRQLVVLGKNMGDRRTVNDYKSRLRSIETVYSLKGTRSVTLQRVFWSRFIYALKEATLRRELAFREPFANHVSAIQLVLAPTLPPLISA